MFSAPVFVLFVSVVQHVVADRKSAYIKTKIRVVECKDIPNDGICPSDHKIPDFSMSSGDDGKPIPPVYNKTTINATLSGLLVLFRSQKEMCRKSVRPFYCSRFLPVCEADGDFFIRDGDKTKKLCEQVRILCSNNTLPENLLDSLINCTELKAIKTPKRSITCQKYSVIPNDPYPCSKRKYMGPSVFMTGERTKAVQDHHNMLKKVAGKLDKKCVDDVAEVVCAATAPACSLNEKYVVDVVSKQDCNKTLACLGAAKDANLTASMEKICDHLANSETAKTIPLSDVYDNSVSGCSTIQGSSIIMLFASLYFMQHFF